jgi:hypothetical protein
MTSAHPYPSIAEQQEAELRLLRAERDRAKGELEAAEQHVKILRDHTGELHEENVTLQRHRLGLWIALIGTWAFGLFFTVPRWFAQ